MFPRYQPYYLYPECRSNGNILNRGAFYELLAESDESYHSDTGDEPNFYCNTHQLYPVLTREAFPLSMSYPSNPKILSPHCPKIRVRYPNICRWEVITVLFRESNLFQIFLVSLTPTNCYLKTYNYLHSIATASIVVYLHRRLDIPSTTQLIYLQFHFNSVLNSHHLHKLRMRIFLFTFLVQESLVVSILFSISS